MAQMQKLNIEQYRYFKETSFKKSITLLSFKKEITESMFGLTQSFYMKLI